MNKKQTPEELLNSDSINYLAWQLQLATQELKEENDRALLKELKRNKFDLDKHMEDSLEQNWRLANE